VAAQSPLDPLPDPDAVDESLAVPAAAVPAAKPGGVQMSRVAREAAAMIGAERTLLIWVRTGIAVMMFGFILGRYGLGGRAKSPALDRASIDAAVGGASIVIAGGLVNILAGWRYVRACRAIRRGEMRRPGMAGPILMALGSTALGVMALMVLLFVYIDRGDFPAP
jgi:putative membrane protein